MISISGCGVWSKLNLINETGTTPNGYEIEFIKGPSKDLVQAGEIVEFYVQKSNVDSMISEYPVMYDFWIPKGNNYPIVIGGITMMGVGDSAIIKIPFDSLRGYSKQLPKAEKGINFHIGIVSAMDSTTYERILMFKKEETKQQLDRVRPMVEEYLAQYKEGTLEGVKETGSGLEYVIINKGSGKKVKQGDRIEVDFFGVTLRDGKSFDNSYKREHGYRFTVGKNNDIPGWDEGLLNFNRGGEGFLFVTPKLAYGKKGQGPIKPNSHLVFYIEVIK